MKTKMILFGVMVAAVSAITVRTAQAQAPAEPAVKVVPILHEDAVKVIYGYESNKSVEVKFYSADRNINNDLIRGKSFKKGFIKRYSLENLKGESFWVDVVSPEVSVTYLVTSKDGKWSTQLERTTFNYQLLASN